MFNCVNNLPRPAENSKLTSVIQNQFSQNKQAEFSQNEPAVLESYVNTPNFGTAVNNSRSTSDVFIRPCSMDKPCNRFKRCGCANCSPNYQAFSASMPNDTVQTEETTALRPLRERSIITNLYVGSITIVGLFIAYRMIKKTM